MPSAQERFRAKDVRRGGHDVWTGAADGRGVGLVRIDGKLRTNRRLTADFDVLLAAASTSAPTGSKPRR